MNIQDKFIAIQNIFKAISGKNSGDVILTFKGSDYGVKKCWNARIENRECNEETYDQALDVLFKLLSDELRRKINTSEHEVSRLKQILNSLQN